MEFFRVLKVEVCDGNISESCATGDSVVEGNCTDPAVDCGGAREGKRVALGVTRVLAAPWNGGHYLIGFDRRKEFSTYLLNDVKDIYALI